MRASVSSALGLERARVLRRLPVAAWLVVLVAVLHGAGWAVLTPAFQGIDEIAHYGYVAKVAETGTPPDQVPTSFQGVSPSRDALAVLGAQKWTVVSRPSWSDVDDRRLMGVLRALDRDKTARYAALGAGYQSTNPPLYDYLAAVPYKITEVLGGNLLDRLLAVRLLSTLIGALTVLLVILFLRELLPRHPVAWVVGGAAVALQPVFGWTIGSVNNDLPVWCAGAALLLLSTRAFRRGLTTRRAVELGLVLLVALLSKVSGQALAAGGAWILLLYVVSHRAEWRRAIPLSALALAITFLPVKLFDAVRTFESVDAGTGTPVAVSVPHYKTEFLSYLWQFYLPKLPFMTEQFTGYPTDPLWQTYLTAFAGRFGWYQYGFSDDASRRVVAVVAVCLGLAVVALVLRRRAVLRQWGLVVGLVGGFLGFVVAVNLQGYNYHKDTGQNFEQVRYLFPYIGLYGLLFALAILVVPARWRRGAAVALVLLGALHVASAWGITLTRYYM